MAFKDIASDKIRVTPPGRIRANSRMCARRSWAYRPHSDRAWGLPG